MDIGEYDKDEYIALHYDSLLGSLIKNGKNPCWLVVKDEEEHTFSILGIGFHDLDIMFLYKKLEEQKYLIQLDSPPIVLEDGSTVSFDSVKNSFMDYGYNWENPEILLCRLLEIVKNSHQY
jgi:hypothetical protein